MDALSQLFLLYYGLIESEPRSISPSAAYRGEAEAAGLSPSRECHAILRKIAAELTGHLRKNVSVD